MNLEQYLVFAFLTIPVAIFSRRSLFRMRHHGFYRFLSWECILWLFAANYPAWFSEPSAVNQLFSWFLLCLSAFVAIRGALDIKQKGKPGTKRDDDALYAFEKTSVLVDTGIFRYIRHPLYASLLLLTWGIYLKAPTLLLLIPSLLSTAFLFVTAILDEQECIGYFGEAYADYMKRSKRFIPWIF
jgi:protein-S-isoprenylcysteine O-methyltransferase Ste14